VSGDSATITFPVQARSAANHISWMLSSPTWPAFAAANAPNTPRTAMDIVLFPEITSAA
jgi:hypothetical protein